MRLFVSLSYNGSSFCGWQSQPNGPTVQDALERALSIAFGEKLSVVGAGRTDALVNAVNYIAHFDVSLSCIENVEGVIRKINAILPSGVVVHHFYKVPFDAHARFDALSRTYKYFVHTAKDPFAERSLFFRFKLDVEAMNRGARYLIGEHDFSSFEKVGGDNLTSICKVYEAHWDAIDETHFVFTIKANRFLRNMVRATVGTLLEVGGGKHEAEWVEEVMSLRNRGAAGQSVAGEALFLNAIEYPYELEQI